MILFGLGLRPSSEKLDHAFCDFCEPIQIEDCEKRREGEEEKAAPVGHQLDLLPLKPDHVEKGREEQNTSYDPGKEDHQAVDEIEGRRFHPSLLQPPAEVDEWSRELSDKDPNGVHMAGSAEGGRIRCATRCATMTSDKGDF